MTRATATAAALLALTPAVLGASDGRGFLELRLHGYSGVEGEPVVAIERFRPELNADLTERFSLTVGVAIIIMGRGFVGGTRENIVRAQIDSVSGHVLAVPSDYPTSGTRHPVDNLLELDQATRSWLDANTEAWTTRTIFAPRIIKGSDAIRGLSTVTTAVLLGIAASVFGALLPALRASSIQPVLAMRARR